MHGSGKPESPWYHEAYIVMKIKTSKQVIMKKCDITKEKVQESISHARRAAV